MKGKAPIESKHINFANVESYVGNFFLTNHALHIALNIIDLFELGSWILNT